MEDNDKKKGCTKATQVLTILDKITSLIVNISVIAGLVNMFVKYIITH